AASASYALSPAPKCHLRCWGALSPSPPGTSPRTCPHGPGLVAALFVLDMQAVIAHGQTVENVHVGIVAQGSDMSVGEDKLANRRMIAAEFAVPGSGEIVGPLAEVELRISGNPREIARKIAVVDRSVSPRGTALPKFRQRNVFLSDQERVARAVQKIGH